MKQPDEPPPHTESISIGRILGHFLFGILLPAFTLGFEIKTGFSAETYIDPIPTILHIIAVALVPLIIGWNLLRCVRKQPIRQADLLLNASCIGISVVYSIIYLPLSPFAVFGIIAYGVGFLPLSPMIALLSAYRLRKQLKYRFEPKSDLTLSRFFAGFAIGLGILFIATLPRIATDYAIAQYMRSNDDERGAAVKLLRTFGSDAVLLEACYQQTGPIFFFSGGQRLETETARKLYYRVTGESFNSKRKKLRGIRRFNDQDLGGEHVGQRVDEIHLEESRLDGVLSPESGTGYVEWTMVFRNDDNWRQNEARMLISMPSGGVASRVTLWVNDEPREAAFGSKAKVRGAYQSVAVRQRRDPILVNWAGPDLLLAQCFPVPPKGGRMKVRIGMSFPLETDGQGSFQYRYPAIVAENFTVSETLRHAVWYEESIMGKVYSQPVLDLTSDELVSLLKTTHASPELLKKSFESPHPTQEATSIVLKTRLPSEQTVPAPQAIVIDGSSTMRFHVDRIAQWLSSQSGRFTVFIASDEVNMFVGGGTECAKWIQKEDFAGGQDNAPALIEAIRLLQQDASVEERQTLYWFSGPQPIQLSGTERIRQLYERRALHVDIVACLTSRDYNALYELDPLCYAARLYLDEDGTLGKATIGFEEGEGTSTKLTGSGHAHRIWIADQIQEKAMEAYKYQARLSPAGFRKRIADLADRAAGAYLVTQLSGAVVLETDQQYDENDLEAGDPNHVPTVPEVKHYALILGICMLFAVGGRRFVKRLGLVVEKKG